MTAFTPFTGNAASTLSCRGLNHSDQGTLGRCENCGETVVRGHKGNLVTPGTNGGFGYAFSCWGSHECRETLVKWKRIEDAKAVLAGDVTKGATVEVYKGRKVPVGTT